SLVRYFTTQIRHKGGDAEIEKGLRFHVTL
ncbi:MAG: hypothetical protein ACI802_001552, partial [Candidatus Paceibacteria bacterium]